MQKNRKKISRTFILPSMTKQSSLEASNMNNIYRKYIRSGVNLLDPSAIRKISYNEEFCSVPNFDFHEAQNKLVALRESFDSLSAQQRLAFNNDPFAFAQAVSNPANAKQLVDLGVFDKSFLSEKTIIKNPSQPGNEGIDQKPVAGVPATPSA